MTGKAVGGKGAKGAKGLAGKGTATKGDKKKPTSRSSKAGLQFPVGRIHRFLKVRNEELHQCISFCIDTHAYARCRTDTFTYIYLL